MSTLLEQAIIDAEALREAAMKNAEASIVEKYSSEVKAAVESLLSEEFEEELDEEEESDESPVMNEVPYANEDGDSPVTVRLDLEALERALNEEGSDEAEQTHEDLASEVLDEEVEASGSDDKETVTLDVAELAEADEEVELDETLLAAIAEELRVDVGMPGQGMGGRTTPTSADLEGQEATLANLKDDELAEEHEALQKAKEEADMYLEQVKKLTASNKKLQKTLTTLNERMEDVNLSNARLLYTNRVLKSNSLNERQRTRIVESISTAGSVEEAKVIYDTLQSAVGGTKRVPQSLSEAVDRSSPTLPRNSSRKTKQPNAQNPQYNRMRALAGIKGDN
jgi:CHASE3 domain sensor protein